MTLHAWPVPTAGGGAGGLPGWQVFKALEELKRSPTPAPEDLLPIEKLISEAYTIIDKSVKVGTIHKNKGAHRSRASPAPSRDLSIALGWYTPPQAAAEPAAEPVAA